MSAINEEMQNRYLLFTLGDLYAIELCNVIEIIELQPVTAVPETPDHIKGVINLRGRVVPVIGMRERFKKEPCPDGMRQCIIIVDFEEIQLGLLVDTVEDLVVIPQEKVIPPPQVGGDYSHVFIKAIGVYNEKMSLIIDGGKIINWSDVEFMTVESDR